MKKRFAEEQIIKMLQEAACGLTVQTLWGIHYWIGYLLSLDNSLFTHNPL
jgi:hypothetical protein